MSFHDCVSHALNDGVISKEDAQSLLERYAALDLDFNSHGPMRKGPKALLADLLRAEGQEKRRVAALQANAARRIERDVRTAAFYRGKPDIGAAAQALFENFGHFGFGSVRGAYNALLGEAHAAMGETLRTFRRSALTMKRFNRPLLDDVVKAAFGHEADPEAKAFYDAWRGAAETLRGKFNAAGGSIHELKDWGLPQVHDDGAVLHAGFDRWRAAIADKLDWQRMKHGVTGASIQPGEQAAVLKHVWDSIVSDGWNTREPAMQSGGAALYSQRADARFLIFKGPDEWTAYNRAFGTGDVYATMMSHVRSMASDTSVMQRLGPNPAATTRWLKQLVESEGAKMKLGEPSLLAETAPRLVDARVAAANHMLDGFYDTARGVGTPFSRFGAGVAIARNVQLSAKLGGAVLLHTFSNPIIQGMGRYLQGHPVLTVPMEVARGLVHDRDLAQAGMILEDAMHTLERGAREQGALLKVKEFSNWLPKATVHYTGLEAMVEANRRASFHAQMANYANQLDKDLPDLPDRLQAVLKGFGVTGDDWAIIRQATPYEPQKGAPILRFQDVAAAGEDRAAANATAMKYLEMLHQSNEIMVPSTNWRVQAAISPLARPGTLAGEVVRSAMMFKSGFMATFMLTQFQSIQRELANKGVAGVAAYVGASAIALTTAGMVVLQLKNLRAGKDPRSMDPTTKDGRATWLHAMLTSGAMGIYGDFIASDRSSYGHDLLSTLAGPMVTGAEDLYHGVQHPSAGGVVGALRNNTPVLSTHWALSAAYNRIILDQLQYMADPTAHQKMRRAESRLSKDTGQGYFWPPGQALPGRLPAIAPPRN